MSDDEVTKILREHDVDGNQEIDFEEFKNMMLAFTGVQ
jgi:Ca2+-binding EF-hand superfamily protein